MSPAERVLAKLRAMRPRYWDGRVRRVVDVRHGQQVTSSERIRIETLECGHTYAPSFAKNHKGSDAQYRTCFECSGAEDNSRNTNRGEKP